MNGSIRPHTMQPPPLGKGNDLILILRYNVPPPLFDYGGGGTGSGRDGVGGAVEREEEADGVGAALERQVREYQRGRGRAMAEGGVVMTGG